MLLTDRGADASISSSSVAFADEVEYKSSGFAKKSRRVTNLTDTSVSLDQRK